MFGLKAILLVNTKHNFTGAQIPHKRKCQNVTHWEEMRRWHGMMKCAHGQKVVVIYNIGHLNAKTKICLLCRQVYENLLHFFKQNKFLIFTWLTSYRRYISDCVVPVWQGSPVTWSPKQPRIICHVIHQRCDRDRHKVRKASNYFRLSPENTIKQ